MDQSEKVGELRQNLDDSAFPQITYRRGAAGIPTPVLRGSGIRVQTVVVAVERWEMSPEQIAKEYDLAVSQVCQALDFYAAHHTQVDAALAAEQALQADHA